MPLCIPQTILAIIGIHVALRKGNLVMATMDMNLVNRDVSGIVSSGETPSSSLVRPQYPMCFPSFMVAVHVNSAANFVPSFLIKVVFVVYPSLFSRAFLSQLAT